MLQEFRNLKFEILLISALLFGCGGDDDGGSINIGDGSGATGIGGSLAGFSIVDDFLYLLTVDGLRILDISEQTPALVNSVSIVSRAETIFRYGENLLLGTQQGMIIYDISDRSNPIYISEVNHQTACDPVVAKDSVAFITIRSGITCNNIFPADQLIVVDISDLSAPVELKQIQMLSPRGMGIFGDKLFVAEGEFGIKEFDIDSLQDPLFSKIYDDVSANDIIILNENMIITGTDGILQYLILDDGLQFLSRVQ